MWFCNSDLFCVHYFSCRKPFIDISVASKSHSKKPHLRYFCTILHKGMRIHWISLHRWMFGPLYLFISLCPHSTTVVHSLHSSVCLLSVFCHPLCLHWALFSMIISSLNSSIHEVLPLWSTDPGFFGLIKEDLLNKVTAFKEQLTIDKKPDNRESSAVQLFRWGLFNSSDPHNSGDLLLF